jgi:hypothetical protein
MGDYGKVFITSVFVLVCIAALIVVGYELDTHFISPVARQNQLNDPLRTIGLRQDFHNKLTEIITADTNIIALAQKITNNEKHVQGYDQSQAYQDDQTQLTSLITIRSNSISGYNQQAQSIDTRQWNDVCMPHLINDTTLDEVHLDTLVSQLTQEKQQLTTKDNLCYAID